MQAMEGTMSMFHITADRLAAPASDHSWWADFAALAFREHNEPITLGQLEPRKPDIRVETSKWFWNGEQCCNPWLQRS
jgi:hypothetical protein